MTEPVVIQFQDLDTGQEALVIVRHDDSCVVVALSHREEGDMQVVMNKEHATKLLDALKAAVKQGEPHLDLPADVKDEGTNQ